MWQEFKAFINRGNVIDLAVAVIVGGAFGKIVSSLTDDVIMPLLGKLFGGLDFSGYFFRLGPVPAGYGGSLADYAALKRAGVPLLGYGQFATVAVQFMIVAFVIFLVVRAVNKMIRRAEAEVHASPSGTPVDTPDVVLLREILDELRRPR